MAKKKKKKKKQISNEQDNRYLNGIDYIMWLFVGMFILFFALSKVHPFKMRDNATTLFFYVGLVTFIGVFIVVKPLIKKDIDFRRRYEKWNLLAYFTPLSLFIIIIPYIVTLSITNKIVPYWLHRAFSDMQNVTFNIVEKRDYILCPDGDGGWDKSTTMSTDCRYVYDICIKNKHFKKYQFCTAILSERDWKKVKVGNLIMLKGKMSFLGIQPISYMLLKESVGMTKPSL
jgi:hypothetical protein